MLSEHNSNDGLSDSVVRHLTYMTLPEYEAPVVTSEQGISVHGLAKEFMELHNQVETSVSLLDSLQSFLSTFQKDLSAVSGQISDLQDRSKDIENRLKSRRRIEKPLSNLLKDITVSPPLAAIILDTNVSEAWIETIDEFEKRLETSKSRARVKAARDLGGVSEGLRIVAATKLRAFFLALFQPIKGSVTTNMQVIQTSVLIKYRPLFAFLQRQASDVADELQRVYISSARVYYETGFRRYSRSLAWIKARTVEKPESIVSGPKLGGVDVDRLAYAKIDGPGVVLAYMADDKTHKEPVEALLRSLLLVLLDNGTAEYRFITAFFPYDPYRDSAFSTESFSSPEQAGDEGRQLTASNYDEAGGLRNSTFDANANVSRKLNGSSLKQQQSALDAVWKQIIDPVLEYCQNFIRSILDPAPPVVPLLTMIRLTEDVISEIQTRVCPPLESFIFSLRLQMWPVFQKAMADHIETLKKLADSANSGYFSRGPTTTDTAIADICQRYISIFNSFMVLTDQAEETMIFSNLLRLRQELLKVINKHTEAVSDQAVKLATQSNMFESLRQGINKGSHLNVHSHSQKEIVYWAEKEEETRQLIISSKQGRSRAR